MEAYAIYIIGIDEGMTKEQVHEFIQQYSKDAGLVLFHATRKFGTRNVKVFFRRPETMEQVVNQINFKVFNGFLLKCHVCNQAMWNGIKNDKGNVAIKFPESFNMEGLSERDVFEKMIQFGPILNIRIFKATHIALCHFAYQDSADKALAQADIGDGIKIEPKKSKVQKIETPTPTQAQKAKQPEQKDSTEPAKPIQENQKEQDKKEGQNETKDLQKHKIAIRITKKNPNKITIMTRKNDKSTS